MEMRMEERLYRATGDEQVRKTSRATGGLSASVRIHWHRKIYARP